MPPCASRIRQGSQSRTGASWGPAALSPHHTAQRHGAGTSSLMLCLSRCHQTCWMALPPPADPRDADPALGPEHRTPPFLPCAMESLPSRASNASLRPALPFLLPKHRRTTGAQETPWAPHFPASGCTSHPVLLFTEVTKRLPRIISGEMNVLASSQAMGKHLIPTIPPHSYPPGSLEASPTSISPATTWLQASKSSPSSLSLRSPLWYPQIQQ